MIKKVLIIGGVLFLVGFFIFSGKKNKSQIVGDFIHEGIEFSLYKEKNKHGMISVSLVNDATSRIHAISGWFTPAGTISFDCKKPEDCMVIKNRNPDLNIMSGLLVKQSALYSPLSALQLKADRMFGFLDHTKGFSLQSTQEEIRTFPPSQSAQITESGLRG